MKRSKLLEWLSYPPDSGNAAALRRDGDALSRERFNGRALALGQIGVERHACPGKCRFCNFSGEFFRESSFEIPVEKLVSEAVEFSTSGGGLDALFLLTMHDFNPDVLLEKIVRIRKAIPENVKIVLNVGDGNKTFFAECRQAGVSGAYHVLRLREGIDTALSPEQRRYTVEAIREAGLDWYYCCEPIGSEHSNEELADAILFGNEFECFQHAAMARVNFPGSDLPEEISKLRLAQIVAAVSLASADNPRLGSIAVHEPDELGLLSGANSLYAEAGSNPRDTAGDTEFGRGKNVAQIKEMFKNTGWK